MAQDIQDILKELDAGYNPQRQAINDQIAQLQPQADQQVQGLKAQQTNAFDDITNGARDRGMGFSGIPISEQAKYTAGTFLPAVANVQKSVNDTKNSLLGSLNNLGLDQYKTAYSVRQNQQDMEEKQREFDQQLAAQKAAAASQNDAFSGLFGGGGGGSVSGQAGADPNAQLKQLAANDVVSVLKNNNVGQLTRYYNAIKASAGYGNQKDQLKLQAMQALVPGLFKNGALNTTYLGNLAKNNVKFY